MVLTPYVESRELTCRPANQQVLVESSISQFRAGSNVAAMLAAAPMRNVSGTYSMWFEYCAPTNGAPRGIFQAHHGKSALSPSS